MDNEELILDCVKRHWGWSGINPVSIEDRNILANLIVQGKDGTFWIISPNRLSCNNSLHDRYHIYKSKQDECDGLEYWYEIPKGLSPNFDRYSLATSYINLPIPNGGRYEYDNINQGSILMVLEKYGNIARKLHDDS